MNKLSITFDKSATEFMLNTFGAAIKRGFVVDKKTGKKILSKCGNKIPVDLFYGIANINGKIVFIHDDDFGDGNVELYGRCYEKLTWG